MYREEDLTQVKAQIKRRLQVVGIVSVLLLAAIIVSFIVRIEPLTSGLSVLLGGFIIFMYDMMIKPLKCYATHLNNALHGRRREMTGAFISRDEDISMVDGVKYNAIHVSEKVEDDDELHERLFYYDVLKPFPALQEGQQVHVVYHDREVAALTVLQ